MPNRRADAQSPLKEGGRALDGLLEPRALVYHPVRKGAVEPRREGRVEQHEDAAVAGAADQAPEGLLEAEPGQHVVVARAAERRLARLVKNGGAAAPRGGDGGEA